MIQIIRVENMAEKIQVETNQPLHSIFDPLNTN